ncbi:MAG: hypothetical protein DCE90_00210 [Pseudanabaena sp.]|nr:MAG: hypothetical protein DCE90_00210 [Pseudanabaena sp.]
MDLCAKLVTDHLSEKWVLTLLSQSRLLATQSDTILFLFFKEILSDRDMIASTNKLQAIAKLL